MIIIYNKTTGDVVFQGHFAPNGDVPEGCDVVDLDISEPLGWQRIDPKTRLPVWMEGYGPDRELWNHIRMYRNGLLTSSDYLLAPDYNLTEESRNAVIAYRDALRDITSAPTPDAVVWPEMPKIERAPRA